MSSIIRDQEKLNARQLETLKRRQSREISKLEDNHQNYKADVKATHANEIVDIQQENLRQVNLESEKKEKVLTQMKNHLQKTQEMTDKELKNLKGQVQETKARESEKLVIERDRQNAEHELYIDDLNHRFAQESRRIQVDGQERLNTTQNNFHYALAEKESEQTQKLNTQTENFNTRYQKDGENYKKIKDSQDSQFKKERLNTNLRQQTELGKLTESHNEHIEVRDQEFRKGLKSQDLMFEEKYGASLQKHNEDIQRLNDKNSKVVNKLKEDLKTELKTSIEKADDPFYQFTELKPTLTQFPDRVEIKVQVPEHSKQDLQLTINNKVAIVNYNRRHNDTHSPTPGMVSKVNKIETFTTSLTTDSILNPKSVTSKYEDGVMTYVVKKA